MTDAFVLGGVRTPFARYGSSLSHIRTDDLLGMTMKGACERVGVGLDQIEEIVAGCVNPAHEGMGDIARWAALAAGFPDSVAGITINRFCCGDSSVLGWASPSFRALRHQHQTSSKSPSMTITWFDRSRSGGWPTDFFRRRPPVSVTPQ